MAQVRALPGTGRRQVLSEQIDGNGHVSVHFHVQIAAHGAHEVLVGCGVDDQRRRTTGWTVFTAEHHLQYRAELAPSTHYSVHTRVLGRNEKAVELVAFVVDLDRDVIATVLRTVVVSVDLATRRPVSFPGDVAAQIDGVLAEHLRLDWAPPQIASGQLLRNGR